MGRKNLKTKYKNKSNISGRFLPVYSINIGDKFGKLTIDSFSKKLAGHLFWNCKCCCGNIKEIRQDSLIKGNTKSCGCLVISTHTKHKMCYSPFYKIWTNMKQRCNNPKEIGYKHYGGRGIKYDPRWEIFENFYDDMYFKYLYTKKQLKIKRPSIERTDTNGNYCKENCTFINKKFQNSNQQRHRWFKATSPNGIVYTSKYQTKFAKEHLLNNAKIWAFLHNKIKRYNGWSFVFLEEIL